MSAPVSTSKDSVTIPDEPADALASAPVPDTGQTNTTPSESGAGALLERRRASGRPTAPIRAARTRTCDSKTDAHAGHGAPPAQAAAAAIVAADQPLGGAPATRRPKTPPPPKQQVPLARQRLIATAGPDPSTPLQDVWLTVGVFIGIHGVRGDAKMRLLTDDPEHLTTLKRLYLDDEPTARRVEEIRLHAGNALVKLQGISSPEAARTLQGMTARIMGSDARPLPEGEFRLYQLIGLAVVDEDGAPVGTVADLMETGANDVFVIDPGDGSADVLLPYHESVVLDIDPIAGRMVVRRPTYYGELPQVQPS